MSSARKRPLSMAVSSLKYSISDWMFTAVPPTARNYYDLYRFAAIHARRATSGSGPQRGARPGRRWQRGTARAARECERASPPATLEVDAIGPDVLHQAPGERFALGHEALLAVTGLDDRNAPLTADDRVGEAKRRQQIGRAHDRSAQRAEQQDRQRCRSHAASPMPGRNRSAWWS